MGIPLRRRSLTANAPAPAPATASRSGAASASASASGSESPPGSRSVSPLPRARLSRVMSYSEGASPAPPPPPPFPPPPVLRRGWPLPPSPVLRSGRGRLARADTENNLLSTPAPMSSPSRGAADTGSLSRERERLSDERTHPGPYPRLRLNLRDAPRSNDPWSPTPRRLLPASWSPSRRHPSSMLELPSLSSSLAALDDLARDVDNEDDDHETGEGHDGANNISRNSDDGEEDDDDGHEDDEEEEEGEGEGNVEMNDVNIEEDARNDGQDDDGDGGEDGNDEVRNDGEEGEDEQAEEEEENEDEDNDRHRRMRAALRTAFLERNPLTHRRRSLPERVREYADQVRDAQRVVRGSRNNAGNGERGAVEVVRSGPAAGRDFRRTPHVLYVPRQRVDESDSEVGRESGRAARLRRRGVGYESDGSGDEGSARNRRDGAFANGDSLYDSTTSVGTGMERVCMMFLQEQCIRMNVWLRDEQRSRWEEFSDYVATTRPEGLHSRWFRLLRDFSSSYFEYLMEENDEVLLHLSEIVASFGAARAMRRRGRRIGNDRRNSIFHTPYESRAHRSPTGDNDINNDNGTNTGSRRDSVNLRRLSDFAAEHSIDRDNVFGNSASNGSSEEYWGFLEQQIAILWRIGRNIRRLRRQHARSDRVLSALGDEARTARTALYNEGLRLARAVEATLSDEEGIAGDVNGDADEDPNGYTEGPGDGNGNGGRGGSDDEGEGNNGRDGENEFFANRRTRQRGRRLLMNSSGMESETGVLTDGPGQGELPFEHVEGGSGSEGDGMDREMRQNERIEFDEIVLDEGRDVGRTNGRAVGVSRINGSGAEHTEENGAIGQNGSTHSAAAFVPDRDENSDIERNDALDVIGGIVDRRSSPNEVPNRNSRTRHREHEERTRRRWRRREAPCPEGRDGRRGVHWAA